MPTLHLLTGCTAVGKTAWALDWAEAHGAEIISCDSLLFYRGMDLGTAKPSAAERARVPHHLIDICAVTEPMNVARYVVLARRAAGDIAARGRQVLVVGGSGFYLKAFLAPVADEQETPPEVRGRVAEIQAAGGLPALVSELRRLNPDGLGRLDLANPRRVVRALERCLAAGRPLREMEEEFGRRESAFAGWTIELTRLERPAEEMERRILSRAATMVASGLLDEVRALRSAGLERNPSAARAIGYREALEVLEGRAPESELAGAIARSTRALIKKQRTWFRTQLPPHRVLAPG